MSKTVFLLGAGASVDAGVPVMKDFWNVARRNWKIGNLEPYNEDFEKVERALIALQETQSYTNIDYSNLESFVTSIEMAALLDKLPGFEPDEIDQLIDSIKNVIVATIEEELIFKVNNDGITTPPKGYDDFAILLSQLKNKADPAHNISVLTFNYDIGLDYSLAFHNLGPEYCLETSIDDDKIKLLKLHGSTNWSVDKNNEEIKYIPLDSIVNNKRKSLSEAYTKLKLSNDIEEVLGPDAEKTPFIAPPSWNKIDYQRNLKNVWKHAAEELSLAENLVIIGFSMPDTDLFFKNLFALGMVGDKALQNVWIFNPDKTLEERYKKFLGPTSLHKFKFNPNIDTNTEIPDKYDLPEGYFLNAIYAIASEYYLEHQFPGSKGPWLVR